jgi:hypothetical protein
MLGCIIVISALFVILIDYLVARKFEKIANMKGYYGYFWWCFWLTFTGYLMVIALPVKTSVKSDETLIKSNNNNLFNDDLPEI